MLKLIVFITVFVSSLSFRFGIFQQGIKEEPGKQAPQDIPKLLSYLGKGYNLIKGNPYTNRIDEGFETVVFDFSYSKNMTTDDGSYLIPDYTHSALAKSCSLEPITSSYSGTQNYQKELSSVTKFDSRIPASFLKAAFTLSTTFSEFSSSSVSKNQTLTSANVQCSIYEHEMPIYTNQIGLTKDFQAGVLQATNSGDWKDFFAHFGSHYATNVIFGGRYVYQHAYSTKTIALFENMELDVNIAAQVQFANRFHLNMSQDLKKYQNQTNAINTKVQTEIASEIGSEPPDSGSWKDWQKAVKVNLAPISYELTSLSVLFSFIPKLNVDQATAGFMSYLQSYCKKQYCPPIQPDRPPPKPLVVSFSQVQEIHGKVMSPNTFNTKDSAIKVGMRVYKVQMGSQGAIDSIQVFLTDGIVEHALNKTGSYPFNHEYVVPKGDEIQCIRYGIKLVRDNWAFASLQFVTVKKVESEVYKGTFDADLSQISCLQSSDDHFIGFYGHFGVTFDGLGMNIIKEELQQ